MLTAAHERADAELPDRGLDPIPKTRQPTEASRARRDIRLLDDLAQRAEIGKRVRHGRSATRNGQPYPRPAAQRSQRRVHRSIQLVEEAKKPIGWYPLQRAPSLQPGERFQPA